ncbi:MAG: hypothetical protein K6F34_01475 [Lachnospiraceae bacterium]|nr:hypothetical protein [Lachnospiraceae bacterium]
MSADKKKILTTVLIIIVMILIAGTRLSPYLHDDSGRGGVGADGIESAETPPQGAGADQGLSAESPESPAENPLQADSAPSFRNRRLLNEHYEKHGMDMGFKSAEEYERAAAAVTLNPDALHKKEAEDGDDVYYLEATNEFVIVSTDGYIRTYFLPDSGIKYFNKQ